jgi:hypothetical protein
MVKSVSFKFVSPTYASHAKLSVLNLHFTEQDDEDNMEEINLDNVIGRRTRGKVIDFAKAAEENPPEEDDDEDDDEDFEVPEESAQESEREDSRMDTD